MFATFFNFSCHFSVQAIDQIRIHVIRIRIRQINSNNGRIRIRNNVKKDRIIARSGSAKIWSPQLAHFTIKFKNPWQVAKWRQFCTSRPQSLQIILKFTDRFWQSAVIGIGGFFCKQRPFLQHRNMNTEQHFQGYRSMVVITHQATQL